MKPVKLLLRGVVRMPLSHKIIRYKEIILDDLSLKHSLDLRHRFTVHKTQDHPEQDEIKQVDETCEGNQEIDNTIQELLSGAKREAEDILQKARKNAVGIITGARQKAALEAEKIKEDAAGEGRDKGYNAGMDEAIKEASSIKSEAKAVLAQAEEARREKLAHIKDEVRCLALEIAEKLLNRELQTNAEAVMAIVDEAMQMVGNRPYVLLWVHSRDKQICEKHRDQLLGHLPPKAELQIMADDAVEPGGCVVETDYSKVDARLSTRWQSLLAAIKEESK